MHKRQGFTLSGTGLFLLSMTVQVGHANLMYAMMEHIAHHTLCCLVSCTWAQFIFVAGSAAWLLLQHSEKHEDLSSTGRRYDVRPLSCKYYTYLFKGDVVTMRYYSWHHKSAYTRLHFCSLEHCCASQTDM